MRIIQIVLVLGAFLCLAFYLRYLRSVALDRLIAVLLFGLAVFFILIPDATIAVAHFLGVGRGTDLVLYLFIVGVSFVSILLYSKLHRLERQQTELARSIAIANATTPSRGEPR